MLTIIVPAKPPMEYWDESKEEFVSITADNALTHPQKLVLEHSLISITKWESKYKIPFVDGGKKTDEQLKYYIECMTINGGVDHNAYDNLTDENIKEIQDYIDDPMSAEHLYNWNKGRRGNRQKITSDRIYMWMIKLNMPIELCEKWHLNRLLTLIQLCQQDNEPPRKLSPKEIYALNEERKKKYRTKG